MRKIIILFFISLFVFAGVKICLAANLGDTWTNTGDLTSATNVYCLMQAADGAIYAGTYPDGNVFKSIDDGLTWTNTADLVGATGVHALTQASDGAIYAGSYPGSNIFKSIDNGASWTDIKSFGGSNVYKIIQTSDGAIFAATDKSGNVYKSIDGGATWGNTGDLRGAENVYTVIAASSGTLYAGTYPDGNVFKSIDSGVSWTNTGDLANASYVDSLLETESGVLFAGARGDSLGRVYRSADNGQTWGITGDLQGALVVVEHLVQLPELSIFAATVGEGAVFKTIDSGINWSKTGVLSGATWIYNLLLTQNNSLLAATNNGVFRTRGSEQKGEDKKEENDINRKKLEDGDKNQPIIGKDVEVIFKVLPKNPEKYYFKLKKINKSPKKLTKNKTLPFYWRLTTNLRKNFKLNLKIKYKESQINLLQPKNRSLKYKEKKLKLMFKKEKDKKWTVLKGVKHKLKNNRFEVAFKYFLKTKNYFAITIK